MNPETVKSEMHQLTENRMALTYRPAHRTYKKPLPGYYQPWLASFPISGSSKRNPRFGRIKRIRRQRQGAIDRFRRNNENPVSTEINPIFPPAPGKCTNEGNAAF